MSRHRDIRNMKYTEEYAGYDDVYGHSVDDDFCLSPSNTQYIFKRDHSSNDANSQQLSTSHEDDEEEETIQVVKFPDDKSKTETRTNQDEAGFSDSSSFLNVLKRDEETPSSANDLDPSRTKSSRKPPKTVTKGFDLTSKPTPSPNTTRTQKPTTSDNGKEHLYLVAVGHVDAGKSTIMGHLLYDLGQINQKTFHKYEQESRKLGKQSFVYAWVLDETEEERNRGITMDVGRYHFETSSKSITVLDAPGHKDFIPNMISGASQADAAVLVVDATRGEFETGFDFGGQTREHALLVRSLGVGQMVVAVNKLDTVNWSKERFDEISAKLWAFLKQAGFRQNDVTFVPCSGLSGQNLVGKPTENELSKWYQGPSLLEVIDRFKIPERAVDQPLRISINDVFKGTGSSGLCVSGRVETGTVAIGDRLLVCPNKELATVKTLQDNQSTVQAGNEAVITLTGIEAQNVQIGHILCDPQHPVQISSRFEARIVIFNATVPITKGFPLILHHQSLVEPVVVRKLLCLINKSNGEVLKRNPRYLGNNSSAIVSIEANRPLALELYSDCKELGRIMLRMGGVTVAAGLITKIIL